MCQGWSATYIRKKMCAEMQDFQSLYGDQYWWTLAPIIVGILGQNVNYHLGFSIAAIGMFIGLVQYYVQGKTTLKDVATTPTNPLSAQEKNLFP